MEGLSMAPISRNVQRMPFAEWLYRMAEDGLPYQARALAVYAVAFRTSGNEELLEMSGIGERTYDKWKKRLLADGWVIISRRNGGRGIGIEVSPALREVPVEFTDLRARNPRNFCQNQASIEDEENPATFDNKEEEVAGVKITGAERAAAEITPATNSENPAIVAQNAELTGANFAQNAGVAEVLKPSRVGAGATKESPSEIVISTTDSPPTPKPEAQDESNRGEGADLVLVNCVSIKGPNFTIDLRAIDMAASLVGMPLDRGRIIAEMYAREWAANNSKPNHPMAYLKKMIAADKNDAAIADVRLTKANSFTGGRPDAPPEPTIDRVERMKRRAAEQLAKQKGTTQ